MHRIDLTSVETLGDADREALAALRRRCAGDICRATCLARCGHPGGSLSTLDMLLMAYATGRLDPEQPRAPQRDRVIVSHGHISPGVYSVLAAAGYIDRREMLLKFRLAGSAFSGHVETGVPGVEWNTGNLGQGLSAGCGSALAAKLRGEDWRTLVLMGDGEQQKGQLSEARRFAVKFGLTRLIAFVDYNKLQIGGPIEGIMPQDIAADWRAAGWNVIEVDGHDHDALYHAWRRCYLGDVPLDAPSVLLARTIMGKGVSFMEDKHGYHGKAPSEDECRTALAELDEPDDLAELRAARDALGHLLVRDFEEAAALPVELDTGTPRTYGADEVVDCRSGYGNALEDLATVNNGDGAGPVLGISCDLEGSVKMGGLHKASPKSFIESGIQEHHAATLSGRLSWEGFVPFFSTFGVFAVAEGYNQQRLNDINHTNVKLVSTHCGIDVGEDGPTHQSIDWISVMSGPFGFDIWSPADANQCDRMIRAAARRHGNVFVAMGRSKMPIITTESGEPLFAGDYQFRRGRADVVREGTEAVIACFGPTVQIALQAREQLAAEGRSVGILNFASLKPIDAEAIARAAGTGAIISVEDHNVNCGLGAAIARVLGEKGLACRLRRLGVSFYGSSGAPDALFEEQGMSPAGVATAVRSLLQDRGEVSE